jgi:hypothetical protein
MPTKERRFLFVISDEERVMLKALAAADHRTAASWLRHTIRTSYGASFGDKPPRKSKR